jgi:hypothetical protein
MQGKHNVPRFQYIVWHFSSKTKKVLVENLLKECATTKTQKTQGKLTEINSCSSKNRNPEIGSHTQLL